jgi:hypothetical protein
VGITGERSGTVVKKQSPLVLPDITGTQSGKLMAVSDEAIVVEEANSHRRRIFVQTQCQCGEMAWKSWDNFRQGKAGCRVCDKPRKAPLWLVQRAIAAKQRCENPDDPRYADYGRRGIKFKFSGPTEMAVYLMEHCNCKRKMQIDRIDNNGDYAPGNLRMTTPSINGMNTRHQIKIKMLRFRMKHPEIRYADATICNLLSQRMSEDEIIERFYRYSAKPKGVYGTFSTPDPAIVSQLLVY